MCVVLLWWMLRCAVSGGGGGILHWAAAQLRSAAAVGCGEPSGEREHGTRQLWCGGPCGVEIWCGLQDTAVTSHPVWVAGVWAAVCCM